MAKAKKPKSPKKPRKRHRYDVIMKCIFGDHHKPGDTSFGLASARVPNGTG
jgi:hypothetical protein